VAKTYFRLASSYDESGKTEMAIPVYKKAIDSCEAAYGANDLHTAVILEKLGLLYGTTGKYKLAEGYFQQALTIRDSKPGKQADKLNQCLKDYASILRRQTKTGDAEKLEARIKSGGGTTASKAPAKSPTPGDQRGIKKASPATSASNKNSK
jgi:tetratricopeptide (TPR) repeat protein